MAKIKNIEPRRLRIVLEDLLGRDIDLAPADLTPHDATLRGLVNDQDELKGVIGSDLAFAHGSGAALALMPASAAAEAGDQPSDELIEVYREVANVVSRLVNEVSTARMRIDPGMDHDLSVLKESIGSCPSAIYKVDIKGYGSGHLGFWLDN